MKKGILAVDLGTNWIRLIELKAHGDKIRVLKYAQQDISYFGINSKVPDERKQFYVDTLKKIISANAIKTKTAITALSGESVAVKFVKFISSGNKSLDENLSAQLKTFMPFSAQEETAAKTQVLSAVQKNSQSEINAVLTVCKKQFIQDYDEIFSKAGLSLSLIDVDAFALGNVCRLVGIQSKIDTLMLVNIGASKTCVMIMEKGIPILVRHIYIAGADITSSIREGLRTTGENAEKLKIEHGLSFAAENEKSQDREYSEKQQVFSLIHPVIKKLETELMRCVEYLNVQQKDRDITIDRIYLAGNTASMKNLPGVIRSDLGIQAEVLRPLENAAVDKSLKDVDAMSPGAALVTGLALRSADTEISKIAIFSRHVKILNPARIIVYGALLAAFIFSTALLFRLKEVEKEGNLKYAASLLKRKSIPKKIVVKAVKVARSKYSFLEKLKVTGIFSEKESSYAIVVADGEMYTVRDKKLLDSNEKIIPGIHTEIQEKRIEITDEIGNKHFLKIPE